MRKLITIIVTSMVVLIVLFSLLPNSLIRTMRTVQDARESFERGGKEKSLFDLGVESLEAGQPEAAWKYFTAAIEQDPKNPDFYAERARAALYLGNYEQQQVDIEQALSLNPAHLKALVQRAALFCTSRRIEDEKCFASVKRLLDVDPDNFEAFFVRAMRYRDTGETDKAIADYTSAINNLPEDIDPLTALNIYAGRARLYFDRNMLKEAIADFNAALDAYPDYGPYMLYGYYGAFNRRLSIIDPESENYEALEKLIARLKEPETTGF